MLRSLCSVALLLALAGCRAQPAVSPAPLPPAPTTPAPVPEPAPRKLVWADEFDKDGLPDASKWGYDVGGGGWGNNELQFYTDKRAENARVEGGNLIIQTRNERFEGRNYTSARLVTRGKQSWKYGRVEVRAQLPKGVGTWAAIWMLGDNIATVPWPRCGEIDIMEHVGFDDGVVHGTIHTEAYNHSKGTQKGAKTTLATATSGFHVYAMEWTGTYMKFFVDDRQFFALERSVIGGSEAEWPFDQPFHLLLNIAVGGAWGGQKGVDDAIFPQRMTVDYVRVYQ